MTTRPHARRGAAHKAGLLVVVLMFVVAVALVIALRTALKPPAQSEASTPSLNTPTQSTGHGSGPARSAVDEALAAARQAIGGMDYSRAEAVLQRAIESTPEDQELRIACAEALIGQKKFPEAYAQYEKAIAIGPASADLHFKAGTVANKNGQLERAEEHYSEAQRRDPKSADYSLYLAMMQIKRNQTQQAVKNLLLVLQLQPDRAEAWGTLGEIYLNDDKLSIALKNIQQARELQPKVARWRLDEARILKRLNQPEKAATVLLALDPKDRRNPVVMSVLAECYGMLSKPQDAAVMYAAAADDAEGRTDAEVNYQAALWAQRAKDNTAALKFAKAAASLGHADAKELADTLEKK